MSYYTVQGQNGYGAIPQVPIQILGTKLTPLDSSMLASTLLTMALLLCPTSTNSILAPWMSSSSASESYISLSAYALGNKVAILPGWEIIWGLLSFTALLVQLCIGSSAQCNLYGGCRCRSPPFDNIDFLERYETVYTAHNETSSLCLCPRMPPVPQCDKSQSQLCLPLRCCSRCILIHDFCSF